MHCTRCSSGCSSMQDICAWLTGGSRSSSRCSSMQGIYAWLTGVFFCLLYICIALDLAVGVAVCKAPVFNWLGGLDLTVGVVVCKVSMHDSLGVYLPSIYMHCTTSSSGCSGIQGIYAWLTGGSICLVYICIVLDLAVGVVVCKAIMLQLTGGFICLLYIWIVLDLAVGVVVYKAFILDWLGGVHQPSIYICIVQDLGVGVVVCKTSLLNWLGGLSAFYIYALY